MLAVLVFEMRYIFIIYCLAVVLVVTLSSWGFHAHRVINRSAVYTLPTSLAHFYKLHIEFISENSVNPDKRRYVSPNEAERHFIDIDTYGPNPFDSIPKRWEDAVAKFSEDSLRKRGIVPWQIHLSYYQLVEAFKKRDIDRILRISADIGHYIADAHSPLHTTQNYNGQLSDQEGIHGFWESRLPELFSHQYNYFVGRASYIEQPLSYAWKIVEDSSRLTDTLLYTEKILNESTSPDQKFIYETRNDILIRTYSKGYSTKYHQALDGMVEKQMQKSVHAIGSFWYSAWIDAGQPAL
ncbi:zinc dependent phospholipase C family protein [Albibacterium profundi]|uniref:Zinc dependent phospholipase C family protein n=1 Tax=Albibacterium profundi TaxID=3134906 RepID=A0ABV5CFB1_9SPHI